MMCISGCGCAFFFQYQLRSACLFWFLFLPASNCTIQWFLRTLNFQFVHLVATSHAQIETFFSIVVYYHLECITAVSYCWLWLADSWFHYYCNSEEGVKNFVKVYLQRGRRYWLGLSFSWSTEFDVAISSLFLSISKWFFLLVLIFFVLALMLRLLLLLFGSTSCRRGFIGI
jgi:hypothetical protein